MERPFFVWDLEDDPDGNVVHLAEHDVLPEEAEHVVRFGREAVSRSSGLPVSFGQTPEGRYLAVVWKQVESDPMIVRVITAYDVPPPRRRRKRA